MKSRKLIVAVIVVAALIVWWVQGRQTPPDPAAATAASPSATSVVASPATVTVPAQPATQSPEVSASSTPTGTGGGLSEAEQARVAGFAVRFMRALARPTDGRSARTWWSKVASMLSDDAIDTYHGITPDQISFTKVTGPAELLPVDPDSDAFWIQPVQVPTNAGRWTVLVELPAAGQATRMSVIEVDEP